jgi:hypothetical protein
VKFFKYRYKKCLSSNVSKIWHYCWIDNNAEVSLHCHGIGRADERQIKLLSPLTSADKVKKYLKIPNSNFIIYILIFYIIILTIFQNKCQPFIFFIWRKYDGKFELSDPYIFVNTPPIFFILFFRDSWDFSLQDSRLGIH